MLLFHQVALSIQVDLAAIKLFSRFGLWAGNV